MAEEKTVQSIARVFHIIEVMANHPEGISLHQLAAETHLAKSTVHRLAANLIALGYAVQDSFSSQYRLTLKMFELSSAVVNDTSILTVAKPHLDRLSHRSGEAVHLVIRDGTDVVYLFKTESGGMRMSSRAGLRVPLYCTGVGKAILSTLPYPEVEAIWNATEHKKLTSHTIVDLQDLVEQLALIRTCGYAVDDEENELGIRCVAVPIPGPGGRADSAFSISSLVPHMGRERLSQLAQLALETKSNILRDLGLL